MKNKFKGGDIVTWLGKPNKYVVNVSQHENPLNQQIRNFDYIILELNEDGIMDFDKPHWVWEEDLDR